MSETVTVTITQLDNYRFNVDFGAGLPQLVADEPAPMGAGTGPDPARLLLSAVANCLSASLVFAFSKFKQDPGGITTTATAHIERNERNRLRVGRIDVTIRLGRAGGELEHLERLLGQFEDFCTVSQSVQSGVPIAVQVEDTAGTVLKPGGVTV
ncbi:MAG TPA: OsmC family protein [Burkholderiales bacterium]|nr:OsmC family protein [Burkholderiales bacterium]